MTALHQYSRLEAAGLWRSDPLAARREVVVGLRKATIVLIDPKTELPLSQWSLPAIIRLGAEGPFVTYASHEDGDETLELDDATMIAALDRVRQVLDQRRKRPGRLRGVISITTATIILGLAAMWVPLRFYDFVAQRLPDALRRDLAAMALRDIVTISGAPCAGQSGQAAAADLARRLVPNTETDGGAVVPLPAIIVLREGMPAPRQLPDGSMILPFDLVEKVDGPDTLAGYVLLERLRAGGQDPVLPALRHAGLWATFRLLSNGAMPGNALMGYGIALAARADAPIDSAALFAAFQTAQITSLPYAEFAADTALQAMPDAAPQGSQPLVLEDAGFLGLQYICDSAG